MPEGDTEDELGEDNFDSTLAAIEREMEEPVVDDDDKMPSGAAMQAMCGAPAGWNPPTASNDWKPTPNCPKRGQSDVPFESISNPSEFMHRSKFERGITTAHPTGVVPVPEGDNGRRPKTDEAQEQESHGTTGRWR